jgi:hypothetical protein
MSTKTRPRSLSQADQRELARLLGAVLDRVYDRTLDPAGAFGVVRRMEGAKIMLEATISPVSARKKPSRAR